VNVAAVAFPIATVGLTWLSAIDSAVAGAVPPAPLSTEADTDIVPCRAFAPADAAQAGMTCPGEHDMYAR
jgi:hypothetical protein